YLTIELKNEIPSEFKGKMDNWMFGCDVCQDVCPWNKFSLITSENAFQPNPELLEMNEMDWQEITEETFKKVFKNSPVKRTKIAGLKRNISFLKPEG
ncbi:MAG: queG, partial [Daejeonella sp.]|nr:queG [Daejeonella sp.]